VRIIARRTLREFWVRHPAAKQPLEAWHAEAKRAEWSTPAQIKAQYRSASILKNGRVVFNIAGNDFRLVVEINYDYGVVYVRFLGTHSEYDKIEAETVRWKSK
jgi:mRNA interferase HigB